VRFIWKCEGDYGGKNLSKRYVLSLDSGVEWCTVKWWCGESGASLFSLSWNNGGKTRLLLLLFRDIKPHNVMLDVDDEADGDVPVLLDFGSMGVARADIRNMTEARALQVQLCPLNSSNALQYCCLLYRYNRAHSTHQMRCSIVAYSTGTTMPTQLIKCLAILLLTWIFWHNLQLIGMMVYLFSTCCFMLKRTFLALSV